MEPRLKAWFGHVEHEDNTDWITGTTMEVCILLYIRLMAFAQDNPSKLAP